MTPPLRAESIGLVRVALGAVLVGSPSISRAETANVVPAVPAAATSPAPAATSDEEFWPIELVAAPKPCGAECSRWASA